MNANYMYNDTRIDIFNNTRKITDIERRTQLMMRIETLPT